MVPRDNIRAKFSLDDQPVEFVPKFIHLLFKFELLNIILSSLTSFVRILRWFIWNDIEKISLAQMILLLKLIMFKVDDMIIAKSPSGYSKKIAAIK